MRSIDTRSYLPPVQIGQVMRGAVLGRVIASKSSQFSEGDDIYANAGWTELAILKDKEVQKVETPSNGQLTDALGVLGMA
jgi:NADPH-dependent curcumin reductase CurA